MIDPVRYLSNISTGVMGFELARASCREGCATTLISGPTLLKPPRGARYFSVTTSRDLEKAAHKAFPHCDVLFMTSAVCDFRPARFSARKIRRKPFLNLKLVRTPDILKNLTRRKGKRVVVGFCLETENLLERARKKLKEKKLDYIVANFLGKGHTPFGHHRTSISLLSKDGRVLSLKDVPKLKVARFLIKIILQDKSS